MVDIEGLSKFGTLMVAAAGATYTALQYRRLKRWRAGDLAANLVSQLETDEELSFCCKALDWGIGPLLVPKRYQSLLEVAAAANEKATPLQRGEVMKQNRDLLYRALRPRLAIDVETERAGLVYRYCFDRFFGHLTNIYRLLDTRQIKKSELDGLRYWLERVAKYEYPPPGIQGEEVFQPFLAPFGYTGVIKLGKRLGVGNWID